MPFSLPRPGRPARVGLLLGLLTGAAWLAPRPFGITTPLAPAPADAALDRERLVLPLDRAAGGAPAFGGVAAALIGPRGREAAPAAGEGARPPGHTVYVALPEGKAVANVTLEPGAPVAWPAGVAAPAANAADLPAAPGATLVYSGWLRGQAVAGIRVIDVTRGADGVARAWPEARLVVTLRPALRPADVLAPAPRGTAAEEELRRLTREMVINPEEVAGAAYDAPAFGAGAAEAPRTGALTPMSYSADNGNLLVKPSPDGSPVEMVIITNDALAGEYQRLADWRTRSGRYTVIRTTAWIRANYPGGVDLAESIRRFIQDAAARWGTGYVLLGGDSDVIPPRYGHTAYFGGEDIPVDLYYQCLDGNWNENGNDVFGEGANEDGPGNTNAGDSADLLPDVFVSRVPLSTVAGVKAVIDKTFQFERTPPVHQNYIPTILLLGEMLQPSNWNPGDLPLFDGAELTESAISHLPASFRAVRMYENHTDPRWSAVALPEQKAAVLDSINAGCLILHHVGHGFRNNLSVGLGGREIERSDADAMANASEPFLFYGINCNSASFDFECIAEHMLANPHGGAFAYVGSTRFDFPGHSEDYQAGFYGALLGQHLPLGAAHANQKLLRVSESLRDGADRWTQFSLVCLGDPLLRVPTANPAALAVSHAATLTLGNALAVTVTRQGAPLSGARVTLYRAPDLFASDTTNAAGQVTLPVAAETPGAVALTVTELNSLPYESTVTLAAPAAAPWLRVTGLTIQDGPAFNPGLVGNGDGHLDPGETADLRFTLQNGGAANSGPITLTLASAAGGLTLLSTTAGLAPLAPGVAGGTPTAGSLRVAVAATLAAPTALGTQLTLAWSGGSRVDPVVLNVGGQRLWIVEQSFVDDPGGPGSDGVVAPNELVRLTPTLKNRGLSVARDVHLRLVTTDARVTLVSGDQALGDLAPGATATPAQPLAFRVSDLAALPELRFRVEASGATPLDAPLDLVAPAAPQLLAAAPQSTAITLSWQKVDDADLRGYAVFRAASPAGPFTQVNAIVDNPMSVFVDDGLAGFTPYYYQVAAQDAAGNLGPRTATLATATSFAALVNFPLERAGGTPSSPVVADLDGDGEPEIVIGGEEIYVIHADGSEFFDGDLDSRTLGVLTRTNHAGFWSTPAVADLDGDGTPEIVAAGYGDGQLYVFTREGVVKPGWPRRIADVSAGCACASAWASPCLADVDGDRKLEIFIPGGRSLYAFHDDGSELRDGDANPATVGVFSDLGGYFNYGSPAAGDFDGDNRPEIVLGTRSGSLHLYRANGTEPPGWPRQFPPAGGTTPSPIICSPALADLDGDQMLDIVVAVQQPTNRLVAVNILGASPPGWPLGILINQDFNASPTIGDIDGDRHLDVVMVGGSGKLQAWRGDTGQALFAPQDVSALEIGTFSGARGTPCLGDITGDGHPDIVFGTNSGRVYGFNAAGTLLPGFPLLAQDNIEGGMTIWDVDGDGTNELLFGCVDRNLYAFKTQGLFDLAGGALPWPMFRHDALNSGNTALPLTTPVAPTLATFTAAAEPGGVRLLWRARGAGAEWTGWNVWRSDAEGEGAGAPRRLNATPLRVEPAATGEFLDATARAGTAALYSVEGVDRAGRTTRFAPLAFTPPDPQAAGPLLRPNQPNPFSGATTLAYRVPGGAPTAGAMDEARATAAAGTEPTATAATPVRLEILDVTGRRVRLLFDGVESPGDYARAWDGRDDRGAPAAAGAYFARLRVGGATATRKMLLLK